MTPAPEMTETAVRCTTCDDRLTSGPSEDGQEEVQVAEYNNLDFGDMWVAVSPSDLVVPGQITPLSFFGRRLVGYRDGTGAAHVSDGYCPHLGAALHLGEMCNGNLRCGMHHWSFDSANGRVCEIPYSDARPNISLDEFHVDEQAGFVFIWWPKTHDDPTWVLPDLLEWDDRVFQVPTYGGRRFGVCLPDTTENAADSRHFLGVHGLFDEPMSLPVTHPQPHVMRLAVDTHCDNAGIDDVASGVSGIEETKQEHVAFAVSAYGLCVSRTTVKVGDGFLIFISLRTPTGRHRVQGWFGTSMVNQDGSPGDPEMVTVSRDFVLAAIDQDIPFWETKKYPTARLVKEDGPIVAYRRWTQQFHHPSVG